MELHDPELPVSAADERRERDAGREQIAEQLRLLESVATHAGDAVIISEAEPIDEPGPRIIYVNPAFTRMTGYAAHEVIGRNPRLLQGAATDPETRASIRRSLAAWQPVRAELVNYRKDGAEFWVELDITPVADASGWYTHWVSVQRDITERKRLESERLESERRYRQIVEQAGDIIYRTTPGGRFAFVNKTFERLLGYTAEEAPALRYTDVIAPEHRAPAEEFYTRQFLTATANTHHELAVVRRDGTRLWVEQHVQLIYEGGRIAGFQAVARDVTERKLAQEALRESEARLRIVAESASDAIITIDDSHTILFVNPAAEKILGYAPAELIGEKLFVLMPERLRAAHESGVSRYAAIGERRIPWSGVEVPACHKDGHEVPIEISFGEYRDGDRRLFTAVVRDITERKRAAEALRRSEQYRDLFRLANDAILVIEPETERVLDCNDKACEIYGLRREEFIGRSLKEMSRDVVRGEEQMRRLTERGSYEEFETVQYRADGTPLHLTVNASLIEYEDRRAVLTINRDITARKRAEASLRESERRYRYLFDSNPQPMWVYDLETLSFLAVNDAATNYYGYTRDEFLRMTIRDIRPPEDVPRLLEVIAAVKHGFDTGVRWRHRKRDGTIIHVELSCHTLDFDGRAAELVLVSDITARLAAEAARQESESRYRTLVEHMSEGLLQVDVRDRIVFANDCFCDMTGYAREELVGKSASELLIAEADRPLIADANRRRLSGRADRYEVQLTRKSGATFWAHVGGAPVRNSEGEIVGSIGVHTDVTDRKRAEEQLRHDAFHDRLTGLPNRALFTDHLKLTIERSRRARDGDNRETFAVLFLDFDRFKIVNDSLGHAEGDRLLVLVARRLENCLRPGDTVARLGGDEFTILLDGLSDTSDALRIAERIQQEIGQPFDLGGHEVYTSASIGIAFGDDRYTRPEEVIRDADAAMYRAKEQGRARHELFDQAMHTQAVSRLRIESELRRALERSEFAVYYQPIVRLSDERTVAYEALVRWQHPERGIVPPLEFIPVAEETGLIAPLGSWVLREACAQARRWADEDPAGEPVKVGVNLSAKEFARHALVEEVAGALRDTGLDARRLKIEITETLLMDSGGAAAAVLEGLRGLGVEIALDDFGTGYSSLAYLHRLPVDHLKIDRSFVAPLTCAGGNAEIVRTIIALAQNLGMRTIAEGIETPEQAEMLRRLGCDCGQGYLFGRPAPAASHTRQPTTRDEQNAPRPVTTLADAPDVQLDLVG